MSKKQNFQMLITSRSAVAMMKMKSKMEFLQNNLSMSKAEIIDYALSHLVVDKKVYGHVKPAKENIRQYEHKLNLETVFTDLRDMTTFKEVMARLIIILHSNSVRIEDIYKWTSKTIPKLSSTARFNKKDFKLLKNLTVVDLYDMRLKIQEYCRRHNCDPRSILEYDFFKFKQGKK